MPLRLWSTTASSNATADSGSGINWAEQQAPSSVNDSARAMMAELAKFYDDTAGGTVYVPAASVGGTANAITLTTTQTVTAYTDGSRFAFPASAANSSSVTVNIDSVGTKALTDHTGTALSGSDWSANDTIFIEYNENDAAFRLISPQVIATASTSTSGLIQKATDAEIRAASSGALAVCAEDLESASAAVSLTDATTVSVNWDSGIYFTLELGGNRTLGNPTNEQVGTWRTILVDGDSGTARTLSFGSEYGGDVPTLTDITSTKKYLLSIFCKGTGAFLVRAIDGSD